ncbi:hypothetical protein PQI66_12810 [Corynebacterium sp. USCH3]|uniref:hypothetical protein n=1 Tax=Corynebacterium sp. USCH3 TaxID=3024840 RepID=UPI0030B4480B
MKVSRRIKAGVAAVAVAPALVFAPTAFAQDENADSSLPTNLLEGSSEDGSLSTGSLENINIQDIIDRILDLLPGLGGGDDGDNGDGGTGGTGE